MINPTFWKPSRTCWVEGDRIPFRWSDDPVWLRGARGDEERRIMINPAEKNDKLLVVDDDPFVREMLAEVLQTADYSVTTAESGADALQRYCADPAIRLIISDMNMPRMNGLELLRELRSRQLEVPVIILTGNDEVSVAIESMKSGANDYLLKDENIQDLVLVSVEKVLEKQRLVEQNRRMSEQLAERNQELEDSNRKLREVNDLKNKFLGIAAHDLRNPLVSIRGFSELLLSAAFGALTEEQKESLTTIYGAAEGMLSLVNDLLDVSIIEQGRLELQRQQASLKAVVEDRCRILKAVAQRKGITIHTELAEIPPAHFDPNRIAQVVDNIVGNAIKFSPPDARIWVTLSRGEGFARTSIRDEGPGISLEDQAKMFGEFQRLSARPTGGEKSTGLGLAIVKKIVEAHGGALEVQSQVGSGSTFSFKIPLEGK